MLQANVSRQVMDMGADHGREELLVSIESGDDRACSISKPASIGKQEGGKRTSRSNSRGRGHDAEQCRLHETGRQTAERWAMTKRR